MNSLDPVSFTQNYLRELEKSKSAAPADKQAPAATAHDDMWYNPESRSVSPKPPSVEEFNRDIIKLQGQKVPERTINQYCGLSLLVSVMAAVNAGAAATSSPLFVAIAATVGMTMTPPEMEKECGQKAAAELMGKSGVSTDKVLTGRFESIAKKLVGQSAFKDRGMKMVVLDSDEVNAHSVPGTLFITRGLMLAFPDNNELALFAGHEIAHAEHRDSLEGIGKEMFEQLTLSNTLLKSKVKVEGSEKTVGDYRKILKDGIYESSLAHDRQNETDADMRGAELLVKAGFSPEAAKSAITKICALEKENRMSIIKNQVYQKLGYYDEAEIAKQMAEQAKFDNHPDIAERLQAVQKGIDQSKGQGS